MCEQTASLFKHPAETEHQCEDECKANIYTFFFFSSGLGLIAI